MKVRVPRSNFTGISHGLKFSDGLSEDFNNQELLGRLIRKGYEAVEEKKPTEKKSTEANKQNKEGGV